MAAVTRGGLRIHLAMLLNRANIPRIMRRFFVLVAVGWLFSGSAIAGYSEGVAALESGNYSAALTELSPLADQGNAGAQYKLGRMFANGWGVKLDRRKAAEWYRKAARQGHMDAQARLGGAYFNGEGAIQDFDEAYKWFVKAGAQGHPDAMFYLGYMNLKQLGGQNRNYVEAHKWFNLSAALGSRLRSTTYRRALRRLMTDAEIDESKRQAQQWMQSHPVKFN